MPTMNLSVAMGLPPPVLHWATVLSIVLTPYGEEFIALPLGLAFGLPLPGLFVLVPLGNFVPIVVICEGWNKIRGIGRLSGWLEKSRNGRAWRFAQRFGLWPTAMMGPLVSGVWTMTAVLCLLGVERRRIYVASLISLYVWALIFIVAAHTGIDLLQKLHR